MKGMYTRKVDDMSIVPKSRPKLQKDELLDLIHSKFKGSGWEFIQSNEPLFFAGIRGYYLNTMGKPGENDRNVYDDAIFIVSDNVFASFNANTDPSKYRERIASLEPGIWKSYTFDFHKNRYLALCQRGGVVTVRRDSDNGGFFDTGYFGINIHKGGTNTTGSEGCQTIHPLQWDSFIQLAKTEAKRIHGTEWGKKVYTYVLFDNI